MRQRRAFHPAFDVGRVERNRVRTCPRQIAARCDLPDPAGPASTTTAATASPASGRSARRPAGWRRKRQARRASGRPNGRDRAAAAVACPDRPSRRSTRPGRSVSGCEPSSASTTTISSLVPLVERRFQIAGDGEAHQHGHRRGRRHRDQQPDEAEQRAEGEQREHQPDRMQADALSDQARLQDVALDELADEEHARRPRRP